MASVMTSTDVPAQVWQEAATYQLGNYLRVYNASRGAFLRNVILGLIALGVGMFFLYNFGQSAEGHDTTGYYTVAFGILSIACLAGGVFSFVSLSGLRNLHVYLFEKGCVISVGNAYKTFPWALIAEVKQSVTRHYRNGIYTGTTYRYGLRRQDGLVQVLTGDVQNIAELGPLIAGRTAQEQLPRASAALQAGQTLSFGPFPLNMQGIIRHNDMLPWQQVRSFDVQKGYVVIQAEGKVLSWARISVALIPNYLVFTTLVDRMLSQVRKR